jgi:NAD(P)-dependent dehydrogenase (short-subunit alcohol dehydrogenase family)
MVMDLSTKTYVVTGATSGIGLATAEGLMRAGANVIGIGRSADRCSEAERHLRSLGGSGRLHYLRADLSLQAEVRGLAAQIIDLQASYGENSLDGLVNNAGVFTYWLALTPEGVEMQWAVNHLASFLLTQQLLPLLKAAPFARVVTVSSGSHYGAGIDWVDPQLRRHYNGLRAYSTTKLANILFTAELNRRLGSPASVHAFAADPGLVKTDMGLKGTPALVHWVWKLRRSGGTSPEKPARGIIYLLTAPEINHSPDFYWKDSQPQRSSRNSLDAPGAARLWALSEKMCGLHGEV